MNMFKLVLLRGALIALIISLAAGCGGAESRKAKYIERGEKYLKQENYQKARIEFGNALQIDPKDPKAHYLAGRIAERLGDPRGAVGQYQAAIDEKPVYPEARAALGRLMVFGGAPDKAIEIVEIGLATDPKNPALLTTRGAARAQLKNYKEALADAKLANEGAPDDEYAISLLASLYRNQGQMDEALKTIRAGIERLPKNADLRVILASLEVDDNHPELAEVNLKKAVELDPKDQERRYSLMRFYLLNKNIDAAEKTLREVAAFDPKDASTKMALVQFLAQYRSPDAAESEIQKLVVAEPNNDALKLALADYRVKQNKLEDAETTYRAVIDHAGIKPDGITARTRLASMLLKRNEIKQATTLIDEALKENPSDADALILRSNLALGRGDASAAITDLRTVLRAQPNSALVLRTLARAHLQISEPELAEQALRQAVQSNPKDIDSRFELSQVLEQGGKAEQSRTILEELAKEVPQNQFVAEKLFATLMSLNDYAAARALAEKIEKEHADLPLGFYLSGLVNEKQQKTDAAIADYTQALAVQPQGSEPLAAIVHLQMANKQSKQAKELLDATILKFPDSAYARSLKGEILLSEKQYELAAQVYQDAIAKAPMVWTLYRGLAAAQFADKQLEAAAATLKQGIEKNPDAGDLVTTLASLYTQQGKIDDAAAVYDAALKRNAGSPQLANNLAMLLADNRQDAASLARAQQLADQFSSSQAPAFVDTRGWVKFRGGDYKGALPLLQQAVKGAPDSPSLRYHLAMVQDKNGDAAAARKNLEVAIAAGRPFEGIAEARKALERLKGPANGQSTK